MLAAGLLPVGPSTDTTSLCKAATNLRNKRCNKRQNIMLLGHTPVRLFEPTLSSPQTGSSRFATVNLLTSGNVIHGWVVGSDADRPDKVVRGSVIYAVDGIPVSDSSVSSALTGPAGSTVRVSLRTPGRTEHHLDLKRELQSIASPHPPFPITTLGTAVNGNAHYKTLRSPASGVIHGAQDEPNGNNVVAQHVQNAPSSADFEEELQVSRKAAAAAARRAEKLEKEVEELRRDILARQSGSPWRDSTPSSSNATGLNIESELKRMIEKLKDPSSTEGTSDDGTKNSKVESDLLECRRLLERAMNSEMHLAQMNHNLEREFKARATRFLETVAPLENCALGMARELTQARTEIDHLKTKLAEAIVSRNVPDHSRTAGTTSTNNIPRSIVPPQSVVSAPLTSTEEPNWKRELVNIRNTLAESQRALGREMELPTTFHIVSQSSALPVVRHSSPFRVSSPLGEKDLQGTISRVREMRQGLERSLFQDSSVYSSPGFNNGITRVASPRVVSDPTWLM